MSIAKSDRTILWNQYEILKAIKPDDELWLEALQEIVREGYEAHYDLLSPSFDEPLPAERSRVVYDIFDMYVDLQRAARDSGDELDEHETRFPGFDINSEGRLSGYATFLREKLDAYGHVETLHDDLNSHMPMMDQYQRMLTVYTQVRSNDGLSVEHAKSVLTARRTR